MINLNAKMLDSLLRSCFGEDSCVYLLNENLSILQATHTVDGAGLDLSPLANGNNTTGQFPASLHGSTGQAVYMRNENNGFTIVKYISDNENRQDATALEIIFFVGVRPVRRHSPGLYAVLDLPLSEASGRPLPENE